MPGFIRSNKDETRWKKAKAAASKSKDKATESFSDQDWALVNHIYQSMNKGLSISSFIKDEDDLNRIVDLLQKAKFSFDGDDRDNYDHDDDNQDDSEQDNLHEFDPEAPVPMDNDEDDDDETARWLRANEPKRAKDQDYEEYGDDEDEAAHRQNIEDDFGQEAQQSKKQIAPTAPESEKIKSSQGGFRQPTRDELVRYRRYTRPFVERAKDMAAVQADARINPEMAARGQVAAARNLAHGDRKEAYNKLINSPEYKAADEIRQMEMDDEFEKNWRTNNPDHVKTALQNHHSAHQRGEQAHAIFDDHKEAQIQNILAGGHNPEAVSMQEGLQHAGGQKTEEGVQGTVISDPAAKFAQRNEDFLRQFERDRAAKQIFKKPSNIDDMQYDLGSKQDMARILGPAPTKDPEFEKFFAHYYPLIGIKAKQAVKKQGLNPQSVDLDMLHEAGMHGLFQAVNDYDHDNPSKASFATHAGNKIEGLQRTALKNLQLKDIPNVMLQQQKKSERQQVKPPAPKNSSELIQHPKYSKGPEVDDRKKRIDSQISATKLRSGAAAQPKPISQAVQTEAGPTDEDQE